MYYLPIHSMGHDQQYDDVESGNGIQGILFVDGQAGPLLHPAGISAEPVPGPYGHRTRAARV